MATEVTHSLRASGGDYTTFASWQAAQQRNLVTADESAILECYDDWPSGYPAALSVSGWPSGGTDATRRIIIRAADGEGNNGDPGVGFSVVASVGYSAAVSISNEYVTVEGIRGKNTHYYGTAVFGTSVDYVHFNNCIGFDSTAGFSGLKSNGSVRNSLALDCTTGFLCANWFSTNFSNCVSANCTTGFVGNSNGAGPILKNCIAYGGTTQYGSGSYSTSSTNNASSDYSGNPPPGSNKYTSDVVSDDFIDAANDDFHLASDSGLIGEGVNLYSTFTEDIDGDTWPSSGAWDIGFDYYVAAGSAPTLSDISAESITSTSVTPRVTVTF